MLFGGAELTKQQFQPNNLAGIEVKSRFQKKMYQPISTISTKKIQPISPWGCWDEWL